MTELYWRSINIFAGLLLVHWYLLRFWGSRFYVARGLKTYLVFFVVWNIFSRSSLEERFVIMTTVGLFWAFKMVVLVNLMNSVSIRMVRVLGETELGVMAKEEFDYVFSADRLLEHRVRVLQENDLIDLSGASHLTLTPKGRLFARGFAAIQRMFRITHLG